MIILIAGPSHTGKTAIENKQNLIVEGCYIPFDWENDFENEYLREIKYYGLVMSENYIRTHFCDIKKYADVVGSRINDDYCTLDFIMRENRQFLDLAIAHKVNYILIDKEYEVDIDLES